MKKKKLIFLLALQSVAHHLWLITCFFIKMFFYKIKRVVVFLEFKKGINKSFKIMSLFVNNDEVKVEKPYGKFIKELFDHFKEDIKKTDILIAKNHHA